MARNLEVRNVLKPLTIREATPADNEALLGLCRAAPMRGVVTAYVDRAPDFFEFARLQGDDGRVLVAEADGEIAGCAAQARRRVWYRGQEVDLIYGGDLKVHPRHRGARLGLALSRHVARAAMASGADVGEGVIIHGNDPAKSVVALLGDDVPTVQAGQVTLHQVLPFVPYRGLRGYRVRTATEADRPALVALLRDTYREYTGGPVVDEAWLTRELSRTPSFGLSAFRVAERNGRIVAAAAFWDQHTLRRTVVLRFHRVGQVLLPALRAVRPLARLPRLPGPGDPLRYVFLRYPAARPGHVRGLGAVLRAELDALRHRGEHHFLWASFHQADPLQDALQGLWRMGMKVHLFHFALRPGVTLTPEHEARRTPAYVDFSVV